MLPSFQRLLSLLLISAIPGLITVAHGQSRAAETPTRLFNCGFLYGLKPPKLFIRTVEGEFAPLRIDTTRLQTWQRIPNTETLTLYKKSPNAEGEIEMLPQATYAMPPGDDPIRLLYYYRKNGQVAHRFLRDTDSIHGALQVRTVNLTEQQIGVNFGEDSLILGSNEDNVFTPVNAMNIDFNFRFGSQSDAGGTYVSNNRLLRFPRPEMRLSVFFAYRPFTSASGKGYDYHLEAMRFYDFGRRE